MRHLLAILALLATSVAAPASAQSTHAEETDFTVDEHGHRFRTRFDRYNRTDVSVGFATSPTVTDGLVVEARHRTTLSADFPDEEIWWRLRHDFAVTQVGRRPEERLRLVLLDADYLRHDVSSWILVPGESNLRVPAPFDIVVRWELAGITLGGDSLTEIERLEFLEVDLLADFIRDPFYRHRFAVGFTTDYEFFQMERHELTPLTALTALYAWENRRGTFALSVEGRAARKVVFAGENLPDWRSQFSAKVSVEWTPVAVNDQAVALFAEGSLERGIAGREDGWQVTSGVRVAIPDDE